MALPEIIKISQLPQVTATTHDDLMVLVQNGVTSQITVEEFHQQQVYDAGSISGSVSVDLSLAHWFKFTLTGNVSVTLTGGTDGETYLFWVYSNGNYAVTAMTYGTGDVYAVGGNLPNPANNAWNLYQGYTIGGDLILTEIGNFDAI